MRLSRYAWLGVAAMGVLCGCKGFWDKTTSSSGSYAASGVFYVLNQKTNQVAGLQFAAKSTGPAALTGSPWTLGSLPYTMALSPRGHFLYVSSVAGIYVYSVGSGGALTIANGGGGVLPGGGIGQEGGPAGAG